MGGATPAKSVKKYWGGPIKWASVRDLNCDVIYKTERQITKEGLDSCSSNIVPAGELIICTRVGLGKIAMTGDDIAINQDLRGIILSEVVNKNYFITYYKTLNIEGRGVTVKGIDKNFIEKLLVPVPPPSEQKRILLKIKELWLMLDSLE